MAYEFGNRLAESTAANQNRNAGVYTRTLIGQTIRETPVPVWTAEAAQHPFVTFEDPSTRKRIGISKDMLSYGFLTLAEPGGGKTNLLNMITRQLLVSQEKGDKIIIFDTKGDYYREFGDRIPKKDCIVVGAGSEYAGTIFLRRSCPAPAMAGWCIRRIRIPMRWKKQSSFFPGCRASRSPSSLPWLSRSWPDC